MDAILYILRYSTDLTWRYRLQLCSRIPFYRISSYRWEYCYCPIVFNVLELREGSTASGLGRNA